MESVIKAATWMCFFLYLEFLRSNANSREFFPVELNIFVSKILVFLRFQAALEVRKVPGGSKEEFPSIFVKNGPGGFEL